MSHQDPTRIDPEQNKVPQETRLDIQTALNRLEEVILASPRIPLTRKTLIDEEVLLDQLDQIRFSLPSVFQEAQAVVEQKKEILLQGEKHAQEIIQAAEAKAAQLLNETTLVRQAETAAQEIRQQVEQDCIAMQQQVQAEVDQMRRQTQEELIQMRQAAIAEAEDIQNGADEYADRVLRSIEQQLHDMLRIIRNGRQQLQPPTQGLGVRDEGRVMED
jgi:cell division septum initiation protein DivIVA